MPKLEETLSISEVFKYFMFVQGVIHQGRTIIFLPGVPILVEYILSAYKRSTKKIVSRKISLKKLVCTTLVNLESLFFCNLLDSIICIVW